MIIINKDYKDQSAKVEKVGGVHRGKRLVKNRQKVEAVENQIAFRVDRNDKKKSDRKAKRQKYNY